MPTFSRLHMYLEVADSSSPITGEAADLDYLRQINLKSFNWRISRAKKKKRAGLGDRGRAAPEKFAISKAMDKASTPMLVRLAAGTKLNANITLSSHDESNFRFTIKLKNIRIVEYTINGKDGDKSGEIDEDWTFNYDSIMLEYVPELAPGERVAKPLSSTHERSAQDDEDEQAGVKEFMSAYSALRPAEKKDAASQLKNGDSKDGYFKF